jgi:hypothetical protein
MIVHGSRRVIPVVLLLLCAACTTVEHASMLRSEQDRFSRAAVEENREKVDQLFTAPDESAKRAAAFDPRANQGLLPPLDPGTLFELEAEYAGVVDALAILIRDKSNELSADRLLGTARTLEILARWRRAYMAHAYATILDSPTAVEQLTQVAQAAEKLLQDEALASQVHPRDRAMLALLPGLARYESVVLDVTLAGGAIFGADKRTLADGWIRRILDADTRLAAAARGAVPGAKAYDALPEHMLGYFLTLRRVLLLTASRIDLAVSLPADPVDGVRQELVDRRAAFVEAVDATSLDQATQNLLKQNL